MLQILHNELNEMTILHTIEELEADAEVKSYQNYVRRPNGFEDASNPHSSRMDSIYFQ